VNTSITVVGFGTLTAMDANLAFVAVLGGRSGALKVVPLTMSRLR